MTLVAAALVLLAAPLGKLPEPLLGESITDIDARAAGELEADFTATSLRRRGLSALHAVSLELEWRALPRLGLALEAGLHNDGLRLTGAVASLRPSLALGLLHLASPELHVQLEVGAQLLEDDRAGDADPGEAAQPLSFGVRAALRPLSWLALWAFAGGGAGGTSAHALPARAQLAALADFGWGFAGVEADLDGARVRPLWVAPQLVLRPRGLGFSLGFAVPWAPQARAGEPSVGVFLRAIVELDRD